MRNDILDAAFWIGVALAIILPLAGALWKLFGRATDKDIARIEKRLDQHIAEDSKVQSNHHERIVRVETTQDVHGKEISELRERTRSMKHDILNEVTRSLLDYYNSIVERLLKMRRGSPD